MNLRIWHILALLGLALTIGTIGAADMGAIGTTQIIVQVLSGIGLIVLSYRWFIAACNRAYKKRWKER